jgi:hypothetical protein
VNLTRTLKVGMTGADVVALQRELTRKGWPVRVDGDYGLHTADAVYRAKKKIRGYPFWMVNRKAGPYFARRLTAYHMVSSARTRFVALLHWGIKHEPAIHYQQVRPVPVRSTIWTLPLFIDCTGIGILFAKWAKAPDPSGKKFSGAGRTSDFLANCKRIRKSELKPGDIVQFDDSHACYVLQARTDPLLFSHGMERGPLAISLSAEIGYHENESIYYLRFIED